MVVITIRSDINDTGMDLATADRPPALSLTQPLNQDDSFQQPPIPMERLGPAQGNTCKGWMGWGDHHVEFFRDDHRRQTQYAVLIEALRTPLLQRGGRRSFIPAGWQVGHRVGPHRVIRQLDGELDESEVGIGDTGMCDGFEGREGKRLRGIDRTLPALIKAPAIAASPLSLKCVVAVANLDDSPNLQA